MSSENVVVATFNMCTGWAGKKIIFQNGEFILEGYGRVSAAAVSTYAGAGQLDWAYAGAQSQVQTFVRKEEKLVAKRQVVTDVSSKSAEAYYESMVADDPEDELLITAAVPSYTDNFKRPVRATIFYVGFGISIVISMLPPATPLGLSPFVLLALGLWIEHDAKTDYYRDHPKTGNPK